MNRSRLAALSAGAMFLVASVLVPATALAAGSGSLAANASTVTPAVGSTFTVNIDTTSAIATSGASARVVFDQTKLQVVSVAKGADWDASATANWVNFPGVGQISTANSTGTLPTVAAYFNSPATVSAGTHTFLKVTFFASAAGASTITLPVSASAGGLLDGQAATYGDDLVVTSSPVTITASGSGGAGSVTTNITGSVDSGFVGLTCPTSAVIPLVRNVVNTKDITCSVASNVTWQVTADDTNSDAATKGHMRDTAQGIALIDPMHVLSTVGAAYDHDLSKTAESNVIASGQNNVDVNVTLSQNAKANDKAGSYGIQVLFNATSVF